MKNDTLQATSLLWSKVCNRQCNWMPKKGVGSWCEQGTVTYQFSDCKSDINSQCKVDHITYYISYHMPARMNYAQGERNGSNSWVSYGLWVFAPPANFCKNYICTSSSVIFHLRHKTVCKSWTASTWVVWVLLSGATFLPQRLCVYIAQKPWVKYSFKELIGSCHFSSKCCRENKGSPQFICNHKFHFLHRHLQIYSAFLVVPAVELEVSVSPLTWTVTVYAESEATFVLVACYAHSCNVWGGQGTSI